MGSSINLRSTHSKHHRISRFKPKVAPEDLKSSTAQFYLKPKFRRPTVYPLNLEEPAENPSKVDRIVSETVGRIVYGLLSTVSTVSDRSLVAGTIVHFLLTTYVAFRSQLTKIRSPFSRTGVKVSIYSILTLLLSPALFAISSAVFTMIGISSVTMAFFSMIGFGFFFVVSAILVPVLFIVSIVTSMVVLLMQFQFQQGERDQESYMANFLYSSSVRVRSRLNPGRMNGSSSSEAVADTLQISPKSSPLLANTVSKNVQQATEEVDDEIIGTSPIAAELREPEG